MNKKVIKLTLPLEDIMKLRKLALEQKTSVSRIVEKILEERIKKENL
ncbi:MAG: hypothetical protein PHE73_09170 [Sulfurovaceae bacterium]|nr:hypothetical protein [Sulfurovaceae bacterium]